MGFSRPVHRIHQDALWPLLHERNGLHLEDGLVRLQAFLHILWQEERSVSHHQPRKGQTSAPRACHVCAQSLQKDKDAALWDGRQPQQAPASCSLLQSGFVTEQNQWH